ncbi:hypothetical protein VaNZ11_014462, partial [Volvox africanus]
MPAVSLILSCLDSNARKKLLHATKNNTHTKMSLIYSNPSVVTRQQLMINRLTARRICLHPLGAPRLPHTPVNIPKALPLDDPPGKVVAAALFLGLPASVLLDEVLDTVAPRVNAVTNEESNGVRFFVARPGTGTSTEAWSASTTELGTFPKRRMAVILIHQILGLQKREADLAQALADEEGVVALAPDTFCGQSTSWPFRAIMLGFKYALREGASWSRCTRLSDGSRPSRTLTQIASWLRASAMVVERQSDTRRRIRGRCRVSPSSMAVLCSRRPRWRSWEILLFWGCMGPETRSFRWRCWTNLRRTC